jgi:hypothetical protein
MPRVYIAARGQDQALAGQVRDMLELAGIDSAAQWIDQSLANESHEEAEQDIDDVRRSHVLVLLKPAASHRETTGGHHVETGIALERGIPVLLLGEPENVFHKHNSVTIMPFPESPRAFKAVADTIRALTLEFNRRRA